MHIARDCAISSSSIVVQLKQCRTNMAPKELLAQVSNDLVVFWELSLNMHTLRVEKVVAVLFVHREVVGE